MITSVLVANRGEIARRVFSTCRRLGIGTVAVYTDPDAGSPHVAEADARVRIDSYLDGPELIEAALCAGADAVHPGYGFLSENAGFARAVNDAGLRWIGPPPAAVEAMGSKIEAKKLMAAAGVPVLAELDAAEVTQEQLPMLVKASAGGGGRGMRVVETLAELAEQVLAAQREAQSFFGDPTVFCERYLPRGRHIEVQVMADLHGTVLAVGERECSIQRRHQKVIEEAPSPFLDEKTRKAMGEEAVSLAAAVDYHSADTVEFIVDKDKNFFFLEMNTRLQVEHPVTEYITGLDLVELMIRVADGEKLPFAQKDIKLNGWAIESRIYAEDPFRNFLPSIGRLVKYRPPVEEEGAVRVDTGVYEGGEISMYYDPMIAKLITYGPNREAATDRMQRALDEFLIDGVRHNIPFLNALMTHERFISCRLTTNLIAEEFPDGFNPSDTTPGEPAHFAAVAAVMHAAYQARAAQI